MHEAFLTEIRALLGGETDAFLAEMERPYAHTLRLNPFRENAEAAAAPFIEGTVPWCAAGRYYKEDARPGLSPLHFAGAYYIQEASAMAPAAVLDVQPGDRVLDLCAAPGGKSGQLAAALAGEGLLVSNEPEPSRVKILSATMERLGVSNCIVVNSLPEKLSPVLPEFFDKILVDAPCSGEGMFRRDPATREEWTPASPAGCAARQAFILDHAAKMLRPGGRMAYSTCTFNRAENEETIRSFLERHPEFTPVSFSLPGVGESKDGCLRLWPHRLRGEGHASIAVITRTQAQADSLSAKLEHVYRLDGGEEDLNYESTDNVVGCYHMVKGMEFDAVIVVWPEAELDDGERRRLYTACSRALHSVTLLAGGKLIKELGIVL